MGALNSTARTTGKNKNLHKTSWVWWPTPVIPALVVSGPGVQDQLRVHIEFEVA